MPLPQYMHLRAKGELMKLLILSDSHKNMNYMCAAVEQEQPDRIIHLGDHEQDAMRLAKLYPHIPLLNVCGNCDFGTSPERIVIDLEGVRLYLTHGHKIRADIAKMNCILLNGHTHVPLCDESEGYLHINPGSVSIPKDGSCHSYITFDGNKFSWKDVETGKTYMEKDI